MSHQTISPTETSQQRGDRLLAEYRAGNDNTAPRAATWRDRLATARDRAMAALRPFVVGFDNFFMDAFVIGALIYFAIICVALWVLTVG